MKKPYRNKKGSAIESAIIFMLIISSLIVLIASVNVFGINKANVYNKKFEERIFLSQIGEEFLKDVKTNAVKEGFSEKGDYSVTVTVSDIGSDELYELTAKHKENKDGLTVTVKKNADGNCVVVNWRKTI